MIYVPDNLSLGESVVYCLNMLFPLDERLIILHGDTYFSKINTKTDFSLDTLSVCYSDIGHTWEYLSNQYNLIDNNLIDNNLILNGLISIKKPYQFVQSLLKSDFAFIEGIKLYSKNNPFHVCFNKDWFDFGLLSSYFNSKKKVTSQRAFNTLTISDNYFMKSSTLNTKIEGEIFWFEQLPKELTINIPSFLKTSDTSYKVEYLYLNTLSELFVFGRLQPYVWGRIFRVINAFLKVLHSNTTNVPINFNYVFKTKERLNVFLEANNMNYDDEWEFKQTKVSISQMLSDINLHIKDAKINSFIHGDFCFSNIMYDFRSDSIKTFDPRGIDFNNQVTPYGDSRYDYAKLMHSCIGLYDFIICGYYELQIKERRIDFHIKTPENIMEIQNKFLEIFINDNLEIYAIMIHIFLSMLPLHGDDKKRQMALFANAFRLYHDFCQLKKDIK
ncbi:capsular biosynthesis protein [Helicobacter turcicus]|uniref:capsular biosynthesis protein n=1 Tax=Helicobacter turcicus TaxID=2867412 RepID=UPI001F2DC1F6|nr:capsular biosynthesis protein [Helicobacter turcicus]